MGLLAVKVNARRLLHAFTRGICCAVVFFPGLLAGQSATAQETPMRFSISAEVEAYPAGFIGNIQLTRFSSRSHALTFHAGFNATDRRDWGEHDDETGQGAGIGLSWRYYFKEAPGGLHAGVRSDLWFLSIDWQQNAGTMGVTDITVLQPTAQLGYTYQPLQSRWIFDATVSLGAEINVKTAGEPVGEGAILLLGMSAGYRF